MSTLTALSALTALDTLAILTTMTTLTKKSVQNCDVRAALLSCNVFGTQVSLWPVVI